LPHSASPSKSYSAFLFDMDGTLLSSIEAAERVWGRWAMRHGLDLATFLPTIHGVRAADTIGRLNLPGIDVAAEADWVRLAELEDVEGVKPIPGILEFLASLPSDRWAIVTSATMDLALSRLNAAGIVLPDNLFTAERVSRGKPYPDCFENAARALGFEASDCLVFEDAPAGIQAGVSAGSDVVVITATHMHPLETPYRTLADYTGVVARFTPERRLMLLDRQA
jgi:mannitol-1-/sugar-/sorbitol-6-phosphatase